MTTATHMLLQSAFSSSRQPFFVAGAPKSGTTAIYEYLREHPDIFLPNIKEPHFFSRDLPGLRTVCSAQDYAALFAECGQRLGGEASASYLLSDRAIPEILSIWPHARFLIFLRNPLTAVQAFHQELVYNLTEDEPNFLRAWNLQSTRAEGYRIPELCREASLLQYQSVYSYKEQLSRLCARVSRRNRLVVLFDDFAANPRGTYQRVLSFLGLGDDGRMSFPALNEAKALRSSRIARLHRGLPDRLGPLYGPVKRRANSLGVYPSSWMERWNVRPKSRDELDIHTVNELLAAFSADIAFVEDFLDRPLDQWRH